MIASRTPEGFPSKCPVCGAATEIDFSDPGDDAPCPCCGHLLLRSTSIFERVRQAFASALGIDPEHITVDTRLADLFGNADSLDTIELVTELVMELDEEIIMEADAVAGAETFGDLVRIVMERGYCDDT